MKRSPLAHRRVPDSIGRSPATRMAAALRFRPGQSGGRDRVSPTERNGTGSPDSRAASTSGPVPQPAERAPRPTIRSPGNCGTVAWLRAWLVWKLSLVHRPMLQLAGWDLVIRISLVIDDH